MNRLSMRIYVSLWKGGSITYILGRLGINMLLHCLKNTFSKHKMFFKELAFPFVRGNSECTCSYAELFVVKPEVEILKVFVERMVLKIWIGTLLLIFGMSCCNSLGTIEKMHLHYLLIMCIFLVDIHLVDKYNNS